MGKYLDGNGLSYLISKIKTALSGKSDTGHTHAADDVTSGTFAADTIPSLAISKITNLQTTLDGKADDSDLDALLPKQPASADLPQASTSNTLFPLVLGNTFANDGKVNYLTKANFQTWLGWSDKADASALSNYATLTANTFTGIQTVKDGSINRDGSAPSSDDWSDNYIAYHDKDGEILADWRCVQRATSNRMESIFRCYKEVSGTAKENRITVGVNADGTAYYWMSDAAAFRSALGLGGAATMDTGTSGTTVALGNHTHSIYYSSSVSRTANTVLAAPNGSAGGATFRKIVAADISGSLTQNTSGSAGSAAKLTTARSLYVALGTAYDSANPVTFDGSAAKALPISGTLGKGHGGTGKTNTDTTYYGAKSLYAPTTPGTGNVTLSETAANYSMLLIQYRDNDSNYSSKLIIGPNGKRVVLDMLYGVSGVGNLKSRTVTISGTSITTVSGSTMDAAHNGGAGTTNHIYITQVWGWK